MFIKNQSIENPSNGWSFSPIKSFFEKKFSFFNAFDSTHFMMQILEIQHDKNLYLEAEQDEFEKSIVNIQIISDNEKNLNSMAKVIDKIYYDYKL